MLAQSVGTLTSRHSGTGIQCKTDRRSREVDRAEWLHGKNSAPAVVLCTKSGVGASLPSEPDAAAAARPSRSTADPPTPRGGFLLLPPVSEATLRPAAMARWLPTTEDIVFALRVEPYCQSVPLLAAARGRWCWAGAACTERVHEPDEAPASVGLPREYR